MRKTALLMLCAGVVAGEQVMAAPINGAAYPGQANYGAPAGNSDAAVFEVLSRVEQLQSEVQQLRGMVEEQAQTIADLQRKQGNMYSDLDDRLQALSSNTQTPAAAAPAAAGSEAAVPAQPTAAPVVAVSTPVVQPPPAQPAIPPSLQNEAKPLVAGNTTVPAATAAPSTAPQGNEKERYQLAYDTLRNGHNQQAVKMFETLLADYPAGEFSDNAQYWLGEAHKINRDYDKARAAFNKVVSQYANSTKVPDALLKLGFIEADLQNSAKARDYLTRVVTNYPGTTAAHLASKKLAQMPQ